MSGCSKMKGKETNEVELEVVFVEKDELKMTKFYLELDEVDSTCMRKQVRRD